MKNKKLKFRVTTYDYKIISRFKTKFCYLIIFKNLLLNTKR